MSEPGQSSSNRPRGGKSRVSPERALDEVSATDPERVYAYADALERESREDAPAPGPAPRLETWVTFELESEVYALPVTPIREVLRVGGITRVPHAPEPIRGVTQLRGRVIPVVDLGLRLGLSARREAATSRILVVQSKGRLLGLLVDRVHQVIQLDLNRAQAPPEDALSAQTDYVNAVFHLADRLILMLDVDRVLTLRDASPDPNSRTRSDAPGNHG